jgi:hypothetical protein
MFERGRVEHKITAGTFQEGDDEHRRNQACNEVDTGSGQHPLPPSISWEIYGTIRFVLL